MNVREMRRFPAKWRDNKLHYTKILLPLLFIRVYIFSFQLYSFYIHLFHAVYPRMYFVNDNNISNDLTLNEIRSKKVELRTRPKRTYPSIKNTEGSLNVTLHVYTLVFKFLNHRALSKYKNQSPRPIHISNYLQVDRDLPSFHTFISQAHRNRNVHVSEFLLFSSILPLPLFFSMSSLL